MKATLKFNLSDFDERREHKVATKATDLLLSLSDIQDELRDVYKYNKGISVGQAVEIGDSKSLVISERESELLFHFAETLRSRFYEILNERKVDLDDLLY